MLILYPNESTQLHRYSQVVGNELDMIPVGVLGGRSDLCSFWWAWERFDSCLFLECRTVCVELKRTAGRNCRTASLCLVVAVAEDYRAFTHPMSGPLCDALVSARVRLSTGVLWGFRILSDVFGSFFGKAAGACAPTSYCVSNLLCCNSVSPKSPL